MFLQIFSLIQQHLASKSLPEPGLLITDFDRALVNSTGATFTLAAHKLCIFHIFLNIDKAVARFRVTDEAPTFYASTIRRHVRLLHKSVCFAEYRVRLEAFEKELSPEIPELSKMWDYLRFLCSHAHHFVIGYENVIAFCAGMFASSISESFNGNVKGLLCTRGSLVEVVKTTDTIQRSQFQRMVQFLFLFDSY
jgi:hypothetical protein